jgi:glycopeptide antibiotics resistance protein
MLKGATPGESINLVPLVNLTMGDARTSLLNILLMMPFGFGLPFIANVRFKQVVVIGALFSVVIELLQLITGLMAHMTFRIADINDVIFNTLGVAIGYVLFIGFAQIYRRTARENVLLKEVPWLNR